MDEGHQQDGGWSDDGDGADGGGGGGSRCSWLVAPHSV